MKIIIQSEEVYKSVKDQINTLNLKKMSWWCRARLIPYQFILILIAILYMSPPCQFYNTGFIHFNLHYLFNHPSHNFMHFTVHIFGQIHSPKNSCLQSWKFGQITKAFGLLYSVMFTGQIRSSFWVKWTSLTSTNSINFQFSIFLNKVCSIPSFK